MYSNFNERPFCNLTALIPTTASGTFMPHKQQYKSIADVLGLAGKRVYYCQRCLNHGVLAPRKNHKCESQCNCAKCILVERRRVLNTQLHELEENEQNSQNQSNHFAFYQSDNDEINEKRYKTSFNNFNLQNLNKQELNDKINKTEQSKNLQEILFNNKKLNTTLSNALTTSTTTNSTTTTEITEQLLLCNQVLSKEKNYQNKFETNRCNIKPEFLEINQDSLLKKQSFDNKILSKKSSDSFENLLIDKPKEFRSRISTSNSIQSNATTNSSETSGSSCTKFLFFSDNSNNNIKENTNYSAFKQILMPASIRIKGERVPNCQKCGQHGQKSRLKGHKRFCQFKNCKCPKCQVITERQKLMADQIKIRRKQCKDTLMKLKNEKILSVNGTNKNVYTNSNIINSVTNELIQPKNFKNNQQQTIQQQLLPSFLLPINNLNKEANQQQISYFNTLNLLYQQFLTTSKPINPLASISSNLIENNINNLTIDKLNNNPFVSSTLKTMQLTTNLNNTNTKSNPVIDLSNKTSCSKKTVLQSLSLPSNFYSNNFNTIFKNETANNIINENKEYFKSIIDKPQIMPQEPNLEILSSQSNLNDLSLFPAMILKEIKANNTPLTLNLFNELNKNNEKNNLTNNPLFDCLDEVTLNKMKILFTEQNNSILSNLTASSSIIETVAALTDN